MKLYDGEIIQIMKAPKPMNAVYYDKNVEGKLFKDQVDMCYLTSDGYVGYLDRPMLRDEIPQDPNDATNFLGYEYLEAPHDWTSLIKKMEKAREKNEKNG